MFRRTLIFIFFNCVICGKLLSQSRIIDSLKLALSNSKNDTASLLLILTWGQQVYSQDPDSSLVLWKKAKDLAENNLAKLSTSQQTYGVFKRYLGETLYNFGSYYFAKGDNVNALEYYHKSLKLDEEVGNKIGMAASLNGIGTVYNSLGDISKTMLYYEKGLKIREEIGNKKEIANSFSNIGMIYKSQGDIQKALQYHGRSLKIREEIRDNYGIANSLNNIGAIYRSQGDAPKALDYFNKSLKIAKELGDKMGISIL